MQNAINTLRIQNFKSIKDVTMQPRRVNLLIGMPNVGKSNVLEALSLLGAGLYEGGKKLMDEVLRYETVPNLFYDNDTSRPILIESSNGKAALMGSDINNGEYKFGQMSDDLFNAYKLFVQKDEEDYKRDYDVEKDDVAWLLTSARKQEINVKDALDSMRRTEKVYAYVQAYISEDGESRRFLADYSTPNILPKTYNYRRDQPHEHKYRFKFLKPPLGHNLLSIVQQNPSLRKEIGVLFRPYGLNLVLRVGERKFEIQKQVEDLIYNYPYSLIADTLQRIIFYLAAIESNDDSVLLFEEPEAHTFPVYTSMLGRKIAESKTNQFFVATHSPYLVTEIMEQMLPFDNQIGELAIFLAYYEDYQTKIHQLSDDEVRSIRGDSVDIFYNLDRFTPGRNEPEVFTPHPAPNA